MRKQIWSAISRGMSPSWNISCGWVSGMEWDVEREGGMRAKQQYQKQLTRKCVVTSARAPSRRSCAMEATRRPMPSVSAEPLPNSSTCVLGRLAAFG